MPANNRLLKGRFSVIEVQSDRCDSGWSCIRIAGVLDLALTGILAELSDSLVKAGIPIFAISTYNTDYILVKRDKLISAIGALKESGDIFVR
ncbi:MAG TPA: ACT domain-containing protein [Spirochaetales bacterium]|nr:ACT domain-containing protein [Spirochaetales bacterium]